MVWGWLLGDLLHESMNWLRVIVWMDKHRRRERRTLRDLFLSIQVQIQRSYLCLWWILFSIHVIYIYSSSSKWNKCRKNLVCESSWSYFILEIQKCKGVWSLSFSWCRNIMNFFVQIEVSYPSDKLGSCCTIPFSSVLVSCWFIPSAILPNCSWYSSPACKYLNNKFESQYVLFLFYFSWWILLLKWLLSSFLLKSSSLDCSHVSMKPKVTAHINFPSNFLLSQHM